MSFCRITASSSVVNFASGEDFAAVSLRFAGSDWSGHEVIVCLCLYVCVYYTLASLVACRGRFLDNLLGPSLERSATCRKAFVLPAEESLEK